VRTLTRPELTAALAARQGLIERQALSPAEAIRRLTPLHIEIRRAARAEIRAEAERTARFCEPDARTHEVAGL
jgi:hypothetical protein